MGLQESNGRKSQGYHRSTVVGDKGAQRSRELGSSVSSERAIVEAVEKRGIDLIVICTDGSLNIEDFVIGTITEHAINHASCPVLVIPWQKGFCA
jgi:nucleotide-binding universal stress UspA family protein